MHSVGQFVWAACFIGTPFFSRGILVHGFSMMFFCSRDLLYGDGFICWFGIRFLSLECALLFL